METTRPKLFVVGDGDRVEDVAAASGLELHRFADSRSFLANVEPHARGCVVVDADVEGTEPETLLEALRGRGAALPVIVLTESGGISSAVRLMRAGAWTVLEKSRSPDELGPGVADALAEEESRHATAERRRHFAGQMESLTPDERRVLERICEGVPNKQIATELDIGLRTVELRRARIMEKLRVRTVAELVRKACLPFVEECPA
ncbi:MAG: LuxR C-terminal-related transcriptional regulator [Pirellulales bacterium]